MLFFFPCDSWEMLCFEYHVNVWQKKAGEIHFSPAIEENCKIVDICNGNCSAFLLPLRQ